MGMNQGELELTLKFVCNKMRFHNSGILRKLIRPGHGTSDTIIKILSIYLLTSFHMFSIIGEPLHKSWDMK